MPMTYNQWLDNIAAAYNVDKNNISTSETGDEYLAYCNPPSFGSTEINIVSLTISKSEIIP